MSAACGFGVVSDLAVPMRDGTVLRADLWQPKHPKRGPALLWRTPYLKEEAVPCGFLQPRVLLSHGYRLVVQDVRGTGSSGGTLDPFRQEERDGADSIAWIAEQPWCDGRVVMAGYSYCGAAQWLAAAARPEPLRAIAPSLASDCFAEGWSFRSGVREHAFLASWLASSLLPPGERWLDDVERSYRAVPELLERCPWARPWFEEGVDADYWQAISARPRRDAIEVPVLSIGGWYDCMLAGTLGGWRARRHPWDRLIVGPWAHEVQASHLVGERNVGFAGSAVAFGLTERMHAFYEAVLAGREPELAPAIVYLLGERRWLELSDWPPPGAQPLELELEGSGSFRVDPGSLPPALGGRALRLWSPDWGYGVRDQRPLAARPDVVTLASAPLPRATVLAGPARLSLPVAARGGRTRDWCAVLCHDAPDGRWDNLAEGIARRPVDEEKVEVELGDICVSVPAGSRVVVLVSGGAWPRWEPPESAGEQRVLAGARLELSALAA